MAEAEPPSATPASYLQVLSALAETREQFLAHLDRAAGGFYSGTLRTLERSWLRPRVPDFVTWQNSALHVVHDALIAGPPAFDGAIARLNEIAAGLRLDVE